MTTKSRPLWKVRVEDGSLSESVHDVRRSIEDLDDSVRELQRETDKISRSLGDVSGVSEDFSVSLEEAHAATDRVLAAKRGRSGEVDAGSTRSGFAAD